MAENMSVSIGDNLTVDCLLEIFSYLSLDDIMQVANVCRKWRQVSQYTFLGEEWELYEKYFKREICFEFKYKKLIPILHLYGHHIKYFKVGHCSVLDNAIAKRNKLMFQTVPVLCKNIVELKILRNKSYPILAFEIMATHWKKLEKLYIKYLSHTVGKDFFELLRNNQQLKIISFVFGNYPRCPVNDEFFIYLPTIIEEIKIAFNSNHDVHENELRHFIPASKNFKSLRSLKFLKLRYLNDALVVAIADIKSLNHLSLSHVDRYESRRTIELIANLNDLKSLDLSHNTDLHEASFINIVECCNQLEQLSIFNYNMLTDKGMAAIAKLKGLRILNINALGVTSKSIIDLCGNLEVFVSHHWGVNDSDAIKFLKKATNLKLVDFSLCFNFTEVMIQEAMKIANERKGNILCMTGFCRFSDFKEISTPYFKYYNKISRVPLELLPTHIKNYVKELIPTKDSI